MGKFRDGNIISIKANTGKYISGQPRGLIQQSTDCRETEHFKVSKVGKKTIALHTALESMVKLNEFGQITHEKPGIALPFISGRSDRSDYFNVIKIDKNTYGFRSYLGSYLCVFPDGCIGLHKYLSPSCHFSVECFFETPKVHKYNKLKEGKRYHFKTYFKNYLSAKSEDGILRAVPTAKEEEIFLVEKLNGMIQLKNPSRNLYIVEKENAFHLESNPDPLGYELFLLNGKVGLKTREGFMSVRRDGNIGVEKAMKSYEEFETFKLEKNIQ